MKKSRRDDVIKSANCLIRKVGYSNLSFSQIAADLNITRENVHHYFKKKELLGNACLSVMEESLNNKFKEILDSDFSSKEKIQFYFDIYKIHQNEKEDCPIVSLLTEYDLLPISMKTQLENLIVIEQKNMEKILKNGINDKSFSINKSAEEEAFLIISLLKGALSYSKINDNFERTTRTILKYLCF